MMDNLLNEGMGIFGDLYPDISYLTELGYVIRFDTEVMLKNEIRVDRRTKQVLNDLINYFKRKQGSGRFLFNNRLIAEIEKVVNYNLNSQWAFAGKTGSGKSELAQKLAFLTISKYKEFVAKNTAHEKVKFYKKAKVHLGFKSDECNDLAKIMNPGDVLIRDEQSDSSGEGSAIEDNATENLKSAVRGKNINFFDCQPKISFSATTNFIFLSIGYHPGSKLSLALVYVPFSSTKSASLIMDCQGYIITKMHDNKEFRNDYENRKLKYIDKLLKSGGIESVGIRINELEKHASILIKYIDENHLNPKNMVQWNLYYEMAGIPRKSSKYPRKVIELAKQKFKPPEEIKIIEKGEDYSMLELNEKEDPVKQFTFDVARELQYIDKSDRDKKIFLDHYEGETITSLARKHNLTTPRVTQIHLSVRGSINDRIGHKFEDFLKAVYEKQNYEIVYFSARRLQDEPDLIVKKDGVIEVISIKCTMSNRKEVTPIDDCKPELKDWMKRKKKGEKAVCYLEFLNLADTQNKIHRKMILDEQNYKISIPLR